MRIYTNNNLGFRELIRLTNFINLMIENYPNDCLDCSFNYDLQADEPYMYRNDNGSCFFASDYDIAFDASNNAEFI